MAKKPARRIKRPTRHIYVVRLNEKVLKKKRFIARNPDYQGRDCVYVGLTSRSPEERFAQHKAGKRRSRFVQEFGIRLLPDLGRRTRKSYRIAERLEREWAERLRAKGYAVWQN